MAEGGKDKIAKGYARLVQKEKMTQEQLMVFLQESHQVLKKTYVLTAI